MVPLQEDRAGAVGAVEAGPGAPLAEVADVLAVLLAELDPELRGPGRVLLREPLEGAAVGVAVADVMVLVDRFGGPDDGEILAHEADVERLPDAGGLGQVLGGDRPLVERAAVVGRELP